MFYTIYKIINKVNKKFYVGMHKTTNLDDGYMGSGKLIRAAIKKYGIESFTKEILHIFDNEEDMKNKEKELVILNEMSYNLCDGGHGGFGHINRTRDHHQNSLKAARSRSYQEPNLVKWYKSEEKRSHMKKMHLEGKFKHTYIGNRADTKVIMEKANSPEAMEKRKDTYRKNQHQQGNKNSQYGTCWITNGIDNKKVSKNDVDKWLTLGYTKGRNLQCDCSA